MERDTRRLYYRILAALYKNTEAVEVLDYPEKLEKQSINMVVQLRDGRSILFKVISDLEKISQVDINELKSLMRILDIPASIVAEKKGGKKLIGGVIYEKKKIPVITSEDLERVLNKNRDTGIYVYQHKDSFKVKINTKAFRNRRNEKGYSLGDLALLLNVSRKLIYEYERGEADPTIDKAEKLAELLGDEVIEPVDPFERLYEDEVKPKLDFDNEIELKIATLLNRLNYKIAHIKRTATDLVASGSQKLLFLVKHRRESTERVLRKADNLIRLSKMVEAKPIAIVDRLLKTELETEDEIKVFRTEELYLLGRELNEERIGNNWETRDRQKYPL